MRYVITGGAGFIGGHLCDRLVQSDKVTVLDDLSSGRYLAQGVDFTKMDLTATEEVNRLEIEPNSTIIHLAANPNVRDSMENVLKHFNTDVRATLNVLELARRSDARTVVFASSSVVYGDARKVPTPESARLKPISNYGLFKMIGEELLEQYANSYGIRSTALRFANVLGGRSDHGIVPDLVRKLKANPRELELLGDGKQNKSYVYIDDALDAIMLAAKRRPSRFKAMNVSNADAISVDEIAQVVCEEMKVRPQIRHADTNSGRGWRGDVKVMLLDTRRIGRMGWKPSLNSKESVRKAVKDLLAAK